MEKETYEALMRILDLVREQQHIAPQEGDVELLEEWAEEVAKDYEEDEE